MTTKNKKIILGTSIGVIVAGTIYLLYKRSVNKKNSQLMLEFISEIPKTNTSGAVQELANKVTKDALSQIDTTDMTKIPTKEFIVDGITYNSIDE
jgi:homospermidine synthase